MDTNKNNDVIVIGAGAAGMMATIQLIKRGKNVLLLEKMEQAGRKLRISGKGRCNITNTLPIKDFLKHCGSEPRFLYPSFSYFFSKELISFFEERGVATIEERGGRIYPSSGKAQDVFFAMINEIESSNRCTFLKNTAVTKLLEEQGEIIGVSTNKGDFFAPKVILAAGGESYPSTGSSGDGVLLAKAIGHNIIKTLPALVGLRVKEHIPNVLIDFGVRNSKVTILNENDKKICEEFGELTFGEEEIYGPVILTISRLIAKMLDEGEKLRLIIDFKPAIQERELDEKLIRELNERGKEEIKDVFRAWLPSNIVSLALERTKIPSQKKASLINANERRSIKNFLKRCSFEIIGDMGFERAIITQGGVDLKQINPKTLESKLVKGLYFAAEVMDLDADTGGFNLQIAFSTAALAAKNI